VTLRALLLGLLLTAGCSTAGSRLADTGGRPTETPLPVEQAAIRAQELSHQAETGSLWRDDGAFSDLFVLPKAKRVGDIVTIKIVESSSATNQANTVTERDSTGTAKIDACRGLEQKWINSAHPDFRAGKNFNPFGAIQGGMVSEFDGSGATSRSGDLTAYMTARVTGITGNGNLLIAGSREIEVNNEKQFITLSGMIRPRDVAPDNVILSTYISDAKITYTGAGVVDDRQRPGWFANFLNTVWPF
jgi:flagellar L-ring protein precursor FlgH